MAVLENDTLNILRLVGNSACNAPEYRMLQEKLKKNRQVQTGSDFNPELSQLKPDFFPRGCLR